MSRAKPSLETQELLGRLWEEASSSEEKERLQFARDALTFIQDTGQSYEFEDYRQSLEANSPPLVMATFQTREEAKAWLANHSSPPDGAKVLIAGEYHHVIYFRDGDIRGLPPLPVLKYYLQDMLEDGLPPPVATFQTHEEAVTWLNSQPEPPRQVFIQIAGESYLAVYHYRVNQRALYPLSLAAKPAPEEKAGD
jgi:hypothetical protein